MTSSNLKPRWKPGQSGNPSGRPAIPESLKAIASLTHDEVVKLVSKFARMTRDELQAAVKDPSTTMIEVSIASIFAQTAKNGDFMRLGFLLDRAGLKVRAVEPTDAETEAFQEIRRLSDKELRRVVKEILPEFEKTA